MASFLDWILLAGIGEWMLSLPSLSSLQHTAEWGQRAKSVCEKSPFGVALNYELALIPWHLFPLSLRNLKTAEGLPYFTDYLSIVFDMYVLVTTANSPDVMYVCPPFRFYIFLSIKY